MLRRSIALADKLGLGKRPRLRLFLKHAYCVAIDPFGRGRRMRLDAGVTVRVPTFFATAAWTNYEEHGMRACSEWLSGHPDGVLADVGCSIAIYSLMALQVSPRARVIAFDADNISLKTSAEFCRFSDLSRLSLVHGFLTETHTSGSTLDQAVADTRKALSAPGLSAEPTAVRFLCLDRPLPDEVIPRHSLDGLLLGAVSPGTPMLIKVDVEGAELLVLRGASKLLLMHKPTLLLSVHPQFLPSFEQSKEDVARFLGDHGYRWTLLSTDHEEHWWCEPIVAGFGQSKAIQS
jgi:FkbM family methyltransferase